MLLIRSLDCLQKDISPAKRKCPFVYSNLYANLYAVRRNMPPVIRSFYRVTDSGQIIRITRKYVPPLLLLFLHVH